MTDILLIYGTRPEAVKLGPVAAALRELAADFGIVCTGQHTTLLAGSPAETDLRGGLSLGLASTGDVPRWTHTISDRLSAVLAQAAPRLVVVQGDTMSAHAGALAASTAGRPLAHVEAGVRSHNANDPWPEEGTRVAIAQLADWHFAPTSTAYANLLAEGVPATRIRVTGNTVVSALHRYSPVTRSVTPAANRVVITAHRREIQTAARIAALVQGLQRASEMFPETLFLWPLHPAVARLAPVAEMLSGIPNVRHTAPLGYEAFVRLVAEAKGVITDSGGLVEECATLGVPCVILRAANDRPEAVEAGIAVTRPPTADGLLGAAHWILRSGAARLPTTVYGEPDAAMIVARELVRLAHEP